MSGLGSMRLLCTVIKRVKSMNSGESQTVNVLAGAFILIEFASTLIEPSTFSSTPGL